MFTLSFWVIFGIGIAVSLGISVAYGRRAIHPRLRPHFGLVVFLFLAMCLAGFFLAVVLGRVVDGGAERRNQKPPADEAEAAE